MMEIWQTDGLMDGCKMSRCKMDGFVNGWEMVGMIGGVMDGVMVGMIGGVMDGRWLE